MDVVKCELEVLIRTEKELSCEDRRKLRDILSFNEDYDEDEYRKENDLYEYQPMVFDMWDVEHFSRWDRHHVLTTVGSRSYLIRMAYRQFKRIRQELLGVKIYVATDFGPASFDENAA